MTEVNIYTITNIRSFNEKSGTIGCLLAMCGTEKTRLHFKNVTATAKQAELKALIYALEHMKVSCKLTIYTESRYLVSGCTEWLSKWKSSDWHNAKHQDICYKSEWQQLDELLKPHSVSFRLKENHEYKKWLEMELKSAEKPINTIAESTFDEETQ